MATELAYLMVRDMTRRETCEGAEVASTTISLFRHVYIFPFAAHPLALRNFASGRL